MTRIEIPSDPMSERAGMIAELTDETARMMDYDLTRFREEMAIMKRMSEKDKELFYLSRIAQRLDELENSVRDGFRSL